MTGFFSLYVPGESVLHRLGVGWKYLIVLAITLPGLLAGSPGVSLCLLGVAILVVAASGVALRQALALPSGIWILATLMSTYQVVFGAWASGIVIGANLLTALYAARILTITTPGAVLVDALVSFLGPLRHVGLDPERVGLAIAIMLRSIPVLLDCFDQVRQAARARGQERNLLLLVSPVVVRAVGFAQATGAALAARGLAEGSADPRMRR